MDFLWIFAKRFVAGRTIEQALPKIKELNAKGLRVTLDILGENVTNKEEPERFLDGYINVLNTIGKEKINGGISVKPTMMGMDIDMEMCKRNLRKILDKAREHNLFVRIDMEGTPYTQRTIDLVIDLHQEYKNMGTVIQAYLHRSEADVKRLVDAGVSIRLCKGAYKEPAELAIKKMSLIRENFKKLAMILLNDKKVHHAIGTHDKKLIDWTKQYVAENKIDVASFEFQMLFGIQNHHQEKLVREGYKFRTYVPFGTHWFPYFYRRLRERKENIWFVLVNMFKR